MNEEQKPSPDLRSLNPQALQENKLNNGQIFVWDNKDVEQTPRPPFAERAQQKLLHELQTWSSKKETSAAAQSVYAEIAQLLEQHKDQATFTITYDIDINQQTMDLEADTIANTITLLLLRFAPGAYRASAERNLEQTQVHITITKESEDTTRKNLLTRLWQADNIASIKVALEQFDDMDVEIFSAQELALSPHKELKGIRARLDKALEYLNLAQAANNEEEKITHFQGAVTELGKITREVQIDERNSFNLREKVKSALKKTHPDFKNFLEKADRTASEHARAEMVPRRSPFGEQVAAIEAAPQQSDIFPEVDEVPVNFIQEAEKLAQAGNLQGLSSVLNARRGDKALQARAAELMEIALKNEPGAELRTAFIEGRPSDLISEIDNYLGKGSSEVKPVIQVVSGDKVREYDTVTLSRLREILKSWLASATDSRQDNSFNIASFTLNFITTQYDLQARVIAEMLLNANLDTNNLPATFSLDDRVKINKYLSEYRAADQEARQQENGGKPTLIGRAWNLLKKFSR